MPASGPRFDTPVAPGGYAWWYVDALSDDGRHGLTVIGFVGSVFSPYYAWRRRKAPEGRAQAQAHCAINVALYGDGGHRWAMTERGASRLQRDACHLQVGPSRLQWRGDALEIELDEVTCPWPSRLRGRVRLMPLALATRGFALDAQGLHRWTPVAPCARVEVALEQPGLRWQGAGYLDANAGERPLERDFVRWDWLRAPLQDRRSVVLYDVEPRTGEALSLALCAHPRTGEITDLPTPPRTALSPTAWRLARATRSESPAQTGVLRTLESGPFYARSLVQTRLCNENVQGMHESLSLDRFQAGWCQAMLPFRMPRRAGGASRSAA